MPALFRMVSKSVQERLGFEVTPEHVTALGDDGDGPPGVEYAVGDVRFTLDHYGTRPTLWLTCERCGARVEAGPASSLLSLGALLADEKGIIARGHTCPPEGGGEEPEPPPRPRERVIAGVLLVVDRGFLTPR